jgi:hypothetical protein
MKRLRYGLKYVRVAGLDALCIMENFGCRASCLEGQELFEENGIFIP